MLVDVPQDLSRADIPYDPSEAQKVDLPGYKNFAEGNAKQIRIAAKALANARRPIIYAGGGVVNGNAAEELTELAPTGGFPVTCTLMGLGAFPATHEQWVGMLGMHGTRTANYAMDNADLIVAVGARFDDRITGKLAEFAPRAKFVHIDIDPAEISKNVPAHIPIVGDSKRILPKLTAEYRALEADRCADGRVVAAAAPLAGGVAAEVRGLEGRRHPAAAHDPGALRGDRRRRDPDLRRGPAPDVDRAALPLHEAAAAGSTPAASARWASASPRRSAPRSRKPDELVVCVAGDGSLVMTCQELATAVEHDIDVKVFIMNNGYLGMVRQWQELFWDKRYSSVDMGSSPDWVKLAEAFGARGMRVDQDADVEDAMREAIEHRGPGGARRARPQGGELLPDDPRRRRREGHGGLMGEPGTKEVLRLEDLEAAGNIHTGRKHVLSVLVENKPGVLTRIAGLFARRGFNIGTLAVGPTEDESISRITITLDGASHPIDQVTKQLHKLVNVIKIRDLEPEETIAREMALFKISADGSSRAEIMQLADIFRGRIIDVSSRTVTVELTGTADKIEGFESMVRQFGLVEMVRTGEIAIARGKSQT